MGVACLLGASLTHNHAIAEPLPLPYRSQGPFIPVFDLNGGAAKGLILSAEEVIRGRPAPITIGNATFFPQVRRAGEKYGGYTRVRGDLQIDRGDLYLGNQPVGETLSTLELQAQEHQGQLTDQTQSIQNLNIGLDAASRVVGSQGRRGVGGGGGGLDVPCLTVCRNEVTVWLWLDCDEEGREGGECQPEVFCVSVHACRG
jgi:hypothetical protein